MDQDRLGILLTTLYTSGDNSAIQQASQLLNSWQQTREAWTQAELLLNPEGSKPEISYFFAQTLKTKIQYDMYQLETVNMIPLRESLVRKLILMPRSSATRPTRNQLCLAIADLTIQAIEVWSTAIIDLINLLNTDHLLDLLEILKLIPEETENHKLMTEAAKRNASRKNCLENYFQVLTLLNNSFSSAISPEATHAALSCFLSWLKFDAPPIQFSLADSPIVNYCLGEVNKVSANDLSVDDIAMEILSEIVETSSTFRTRGNHNPLIEMKVFPQVNALCQVLLRSNLEEALMSDEDSLKSIARLIVVTADGMAVAIAESFETNERVQEILMVLMKLFSLRNLNIADLVTPFFEDFLNATSSHGRRGSLSVVHEKLFEAVAARLDIGTETSYDGIDPFGSVDNDFFYFRSKVLLPILYTISRDFNTRSTGAEKLARGLVFNVINNQSLTLQEAFAFAVKDQIASLPDPSPSLVEVVDFIMDSAQQWIDVNSIHDCPLVEAFRRRSLIAMMGSTGSWVKNDAQLFKVIDTVAQVLIRPAVVHSSIHFAAARAFRDLCFNQNTKQMIARNRTAIESVARLITQTNHLGLRDQSEVTEGIAAVLALCEDDGIYNSLMKDTIMIPLLQSMDGFRRTGDVSNTGLTADRLTAVIRSVSRLRSGTPRFNMIADLIVNSLWPTVCVAMETFRSESDFVEKSCRLLKHAMRSVPEPFKRVLVPLGQLLVRDFNISQHSSYLYTAEVLVAEYGQDSDMRQALAELFASLASDGVRIAQQRMNATPFADSETNVDELIEDLYGMIERFLRYSPTIVVKAHLGLQAVLGLLVPVFARIKRAETIEAVSAFTESIFGGEWAQSIDIGTVSSADVDSIRKSLHQLAPVLVEELFALIVSVCSRPFRRVIPSLLMAINMFDSERFRTDWCVRGLQRIPSNVMTDRDKHAALATLTSLDDERSVSNAVDDILYRAELVGRRVRNELKQ
jgi:transportin-3